MQRRYSENPYTYLADKTETAKRVQGQIENILGHAAGHNLAGLMERSTFMG